MNEETIKCLQQPQQPQHSTPICAEFPPTVFNSINLKIRTSWAGLGWAGLGVKLIMVIAS